MRWSALALLAAASACRAPGSQSREPPAAVALAPPPALPASLGSLQARPAALLELFTSEGCSSCPPADEALAEITDRAKARGARVFTLELHVDYWNYLGWADPFSSPVHGQRQAAYAQRFGSGVYTPELVVNGRSELLGTDTRGARARIDEALADTPRAAVTITARRVPDGIEVSYRVDTPQPIALCLAVADDRAETLVPRGENAHRRLAHRHVVRAFETRALQTSGSGTWLVQPPHDGLLRQAFITAYATDPQTLAVLGADATELAEARD
jgi:hypothetical protein